MVLAVEAMAGGPAEMVSAALVDCQTRPALERPFLRYASLSHLPPEERQETWQVLSGSLAGTSRKARIVRPIVILAPAKVGGPLEEADGLQIAPKDWGRAILIRINYGDYGYDRSVIEKLANVEPHFHYREKKQQTTEVKVEQPIAPLAPVAPVEPEAPPGWLKGIQFYRDGERGTLIEVKREDIKAGDTVWVREVVGGPIRKSTAVKLPSTSVKQTQPVKKEEKKQEQSVHGAWLPPKTITDLALATNSDSPIQLADWLWWQITIQAEREPGPGYYDLLGVKNQDDFHERVGFDPKTFKVKFSEFVKEYLAAQKTSGISREPRRISTSGKVGKGKLAITFDNRLAKDERNPLETPNGEFKFAATEQMANLPNGFLAQGLFVGNAPDAAGQKEGDRQDVAPDFIGPDKTATGNDGRIHVGICWRCHSEGMKPVKDWYSKTFSRSRIGGPDYQKIVDLQEKYFGDLQDDLRETTEIHARAVMKATGLTLAAYSKAIGARWLAIEDTEVDIKRAARELGCTPERLLGALRAYKADGKLNGFTVLDGWLDDEKETVPHRQFWAVITEAHKALAASGVKP